MVDKKRLSSWEGGIGRPVAYVDVTPKTIVLQFLDGRLVLVPESQDSTLSADDDHQPDRHEYNGAYDLSSSHSGKRVVEHLPSDPDPAHRQQQHTIVLDDGIRLWLRCAGPGFNNGMVIQSDDWLAPSLRACKYISVMFLPPVARSYNSILRENRGIQC